MPFKSESQRKLMWAKHPNIAKKWADEYPNQKNLPKHANKEHKMKLETSAAMPSKKDKKTYEDYELDGHVRTLVDAQKIADDPHLMKAVHKHAKKKKNELSNATKMLDNQMDEDETPKEAKSIDDIRSAKKKIKNKMFGNE